MAVSLKRDRTKPQDSPMLWLSVLAGSLAIHLIVLLIARWYFSQSASAPASGNPAAIEFVEIDPNVASPSRSVAPSKSSASTVPLPKIPSSADSTQPAPPTQSQVAQAPPLSENPAPDTSSQIQAPPARPSPQPESTPQSRPARTPSPARPTPPKQGEPVQPSPAPPASDRQPPNSSPAETPSPSPDSSPGSGNPGSSPSPESGNPGSSPETGNPGSPGSPLPTPPVPGSPGNPAPDSSDPVTGKVPVDSNLEGAASFAVTVSNATLGADVPDRPDRLAQPTTLTQMIESSAIAGECLLTPEATNFYTQTVTLRLTIDDQGKVEGTPLVLNGGSGSSDYDALAQCAIKRWEFRPAHNVTADGKQNPVMSNLDLSVRIEASGK